MQFPSCIEKRKWLPEDQVAILTTALGTVLVVQLERIWHLIQMITFLFIQYIAQCNCGADRNSTSMPRRQ